MIGLQVPAFLLGVRCGELLQLHPGFPTFIAEAHRQ